MTIRLPPSDEVSPRISPRSLSAWRLASELVPVYRRLLGDTLTPVSAFHKIDAGSSACLFESVIGGEKVGRYSFLAADAFLEVEARGNEVSVTSAAGRQEFTSDDPLAELKLRVDAFRSATLAELPPFTSGAGLLATPATT